MKPIIQDAPGHIVRRVGRKWEVRWQARTDLINRGFLPKSERVWLGDEPSDAERKQIADHCNRLQNEMLIFGRGGLPVPSTEYVFDGSLRSLINLYQTDHDSRYHKKQFAVRKNHDHYYRRMMDEHGSRMAGSVGLLGFRQMRGDGARGEEKMRRRPEEADEPARKRPARSLREGRLASRLRERPRRARSRRCCPAATAGKYCQPGNRAGRCSSR